MYGLGIIALQPKRQDLVFHSCSYKVLEKSSKDKFSALVFVGFVVLSKSTLAANTVQVI